MAAFAAAFRSAFLRAVRQNALVVVLAGTVLLCLLAPVGTAFGFHEEEALLRDVGLSTVFLGLILVGIVTAGGAAPLRSSMGLFALRPYGGLVFAAGSWAGSLAAGLLGGSVVLCCGFVLLRHRVLAFADWRAFGLLASASLLAVAGGAWKNFRRGSSFAQWAVVLAATGSLAAFLGAWFWAPTGELRWDLPAEDILLIQTLLICGCMGVAAFAAAWTGAVLAGRIGGILLAWGVLCVGMARQGMHGIPVWLDAPLGVLLPDLGLLWPGESFYADILTLPWDYVAAGCLYLLVWSLGFSALGLTLWVSRRPGALRGAELRKA